jgi:hypothetical protein
MFRPGASGPALSAGVLLPLSSRSLEAAASVEASRSWPGIIRGKQMYIISLVFCSLLCYTMRGQERSVFYGTN